jgi:small-conductance mechanosensitive channel
VGDALDLLADNQSVAGRAATSAAILIGAIVVAWLGGRVASARSDDPHTRYYTRKLVRYVVAVVAIVALGITWRAFAGRAGVVLGFAAAGIAFAMQEVVGALAGWFNILSGQIFRVGDRIQMGGVRGDVIDITLLRTKVMEIGSRADDESWVRGRQFTGRVVSISNKATFTEPVYNYSASFDYLWEEITLPVAFDADWEAAAGILEREAVSVSASVEAAAAISRMRRTYPIPPAELRPSVFATPTDDYMELTARFVVPVRDARSVKDALARRVVEAFEKIGVEIASTTSRIDVDLRHDDGARPTAAGDQARAR